MEDLNSNVEYVYDNSFGRQWKLKCYSKMSEFTLKIEYLPMLNYFSKSPQLPDLVFQVQVGTVSAKGGKLGTVSQLLKIQILKQKDQSLCKIMSGKVQLKNLPQSLSEEIKICLTTNGNVMGWLYCELQRGEKSIQKKHYLNLHRLTTTFLDMRDEDCTISIYLNNQLIFIKEINLRVKKRTIFPNLKQTVKKSDLIIFQIGSKRQRGRYNIFLIDHLESGNTAQLKAWVRNDLKNKMGQFQVEYFLQNFYLPNSNPQFSADQQEKTKTLHLQQTLTKKQRQHLRIEVNIQSLANLQSIKSQTNKNTILRRVILGERRRRNLVYIPENGHKLKKKTTLQVDETVQELDV